MKSVRFAPSPTGTFHIGNFRTAWISHEWARALGFQWVVRFEDIDGPRVIPGAQEEQLKEMKYLGLNPDGILVQSSFHGRHWEVFLRFYQAGFVYPCFCSRKTVQDSLESIASAPHGFVPSYTGHCRDLKQLPVSVLPGISWRIRMPDTSGCQDFIISRTSAKLDVGAQPVRETFVPAYNWACAIDDADGNYDLLVRAWDLDVVTEQQRWIQKKLAELEKREERYPAVFHCSLVTSDDGHRLEKRTEGVTLEELVAAGETAGTLIDKFKKSFVLSAKDYAEGKIFGEPKKVLTLSELIS